MKKQLALLLLLLFGFCTTGVGQNCENFDFSSLDDPGDPLDVAPMNTCGTFSVRVKPIFILDKNGQTSTTMADFLVGFNEAVGKFAHHGIYLDLAAADAITGFDDLYNITQSPIHYLQALVDLTTWSRTYHPNTLNVFISSKNSPEWWGVSSWMNVPGGNDRFPTNAIVITGTNSYNGLPSISGPTLAHEIGHAFGLIHTFGDASTCIENVSRAPAYNNCNTCGDLVCDTPADPIMPSQDYMANVDANCNWSPQGLIWDGFGFPYEPDTKNLMSYYHGCLNNLTDGQGARMRGMANAFTNYMPHVNSLAPLRISSDVTFTGTVKLKQGIIIESGAVLTVEGRLEISKDKRIVVEPGGILKIDGGILTKYIQNFNDTCPLVEGMWEGVRIEGANYLPQTLANQGKLLIYNGGVIEHAKVAVSLSITDNNHPYGGGIVSANNATFRNNGLAVSMGSYEYAPNISSFTNCTFVIDEDYYTAGVLPSGFVNIWRNKEVKFKGCDFINLAYNEVFAQNLYGIQSFDAGFNVDFYCDGSTTYPCGATFQDSSSFENLLFGVKASKISSLYTYSVINSRFLNNTTGIYSSGVDHAVILRNNFSFGINQNIDPMIGVSIISGTGFRVEENIFLAKSSETPENIGVFIASTGSSSNEIYKNTFFNVGYAGLTNGENRSSVGNTGLKLLCNDINNSSYDISILKTNNSSGIADYQSGAQISAHLFYAAGNKFSILGSPASDYFNNTDFGIRYYHTSSSREEPISFSTNRVFLFDGDPNTCSSRISSGQEVLEHLVIDENEMQQLESNFDDHEAAYATMLHSYFGLIDGGNTPQLLQEIYETWPSEAWQLRQDLLNESPYLSAEVLMEAASSGVLPYAMLLEIILANPDASMDPGLMELLLSLDPPVPGYMIDLIEASWGQETPRTVLEASLSSEASSMQFLRSQLLHHYAKDSVSHSQDIVNWLSRADDLQSKLELAIFHIDHGSFEDAEILLLDLSNENAGLSESELLQVSLLQSYLEVIIEAVSLEHDLFAVNPLYLDNLESLIDEYSEEGGYPLVLMRNLLCFVRGTCEPLTPVLPEGVGQFRKMERKITRAEAIHVDWNIYPNPAIAHTTIEYTLPAADNRANILIYNLQGICLQRFAHEGNKGAVILNTQELGTGMYFIQLENVNGVVLKRDKLIVK